MKGKCLGGPTTITVVLTATLGIICTSCQIPPEPPEPRTNKIYEAKCIKVYDGDTIRVWMRKASRDGRMRRTLVKVRFVGIDTPEIKYSKGSRRRRRRRRKRYQPGALYATVYTEKACLRKLVYLDIDDKDPEDAHGRTLALVYLDKEAALKGDQSLSLNADLVRKGIANPFYMSPSEFNPFILPKYK